MHQLDAQQGCRAPKKDARKDCSSALKSDFAAAKALVAATAIAQGATDGGAVAVAEAYHAELVAPFCFAAVKSFFANR